MQESALPCDVRTPGPVLEGDRIEIIDILRGFALFGILLVNIEFFNRPMQTIVLPLDDSVTGIQRLADWMIRFLAEGKFYSLFSFLFGLGFTIQLSRAEQRGGNLLAPYTRRLFMLLCIGLIHGFLIWMGDILMLYALVGFLLILFRRTKPKTLMVWMFILLALPLLFMGLGVGGIEMARLGGPEASAEMDRSFERQEASLRAYLQQAYTDYREGNYSDITRRRAHDMTFAAVGCMFMSPNVLAMFLLGVYFGKKGIFRNIDENLSLFRRLFWWGLFLGVAGNAIYATLVQSLNRTVPTPPLLAAMAAQAVGAPALMLCYVSALTLLSRRASWRNKLALLVPVGRMPLSNYLAQSLICTTIFYGYGFGLFGRMDRVSGILIVVLIYSTLAVASSWWVRYFQFGPAEWFWRSLTYLRLQPLRAPGREVLDKSL